MRVHFDSEKNERNIRERGLSFESAKDFSFDSALVLVDDRRNPRHQLPESKPS